MGFRNQVDPWGRLCEASGSRGMFMGNRGLLHDDHQQLVRDAQLTRWIICVLDFKGRQRQVMTPGLYTELFFLDEATALAAGHRPCFECRREDATNFRDLAASADTPFARADDLDRQLERERHAKPRVTATGKLTHRADLATLPTGAMVDIDGDAWLVAGYHLRRWSLAGYDEVRSATGPADVLTPPTTVRALAAGYEPTLHPSARIG